MRKGQRPSTTGPNPDDSAPVVSLTPVESIAESSSSAAGEGAESWDRPSWPVPSEFNADRGSDGKAPATPTRLQKFDLSGASRTDRVTQENVNFLKSIPDYLAEILEEITTSDLAYDLRGGITSIRFVPQEGALDKAIVSVSCIGTPDQVF